MKIYIFLGFMMSLLSACSNSLLNAEPPKQALNGAEQEVQSYSLLHGVSTAEANKALFLEANRDSVLDAIEKEFKGRISGIYVENSPTYKIVVRVKGYGHNEKRNIVVGNAISKGDLPIDI